MLHRCNWPYVCINHYTNTSVSVEQMTYSEIEGLVLRVSSRARPRSLPM